MQFLGSSLVWGRGKLTLEKSSGDVFSPALVDSKACSASTGIGHTGASLQSKAKAWVQFKETAYQFNKYMCMCLIMGFF